MRRSTVLRPGQWTRLIAAGRADCATARMVRAWIAGPVRRVDRRL